MTIQESSHSIEGALIAFVGHTPAVNMAGGFKEDVGGAWRKCRHCLAVNSMIQTKVKYKLLSCPHNTLRVCCYQLKDNCLFIIVCRRRISNEK